MRSGGGFTDHLINVLAVCAALLSLVGFGYIVHHALKARQDMDDASDLTAAAIRGDIESQRRLAACYVEGCPPLPRSDIIACAWRRIALQTAGTAAEDAERARAICDTLSAQDAGIAEKPGGPWSTVSNPAVPWPAPSARALAGDTRASLLARVPGSAGAGRAACTS